MMGPSVQDQQHRGASQSLWQKCFFPRLDQMLKQQSVMHPLSTHRCSFLTNHNFGEFSKFKIT